MTDNEKTCTPSVKGTPDVITIKLPTPVTDSNADSIEIMLEIWDKPNRSWSMVRTGEPAANRVRRTVTGRALLPMAGNIEMSGSITAASTTSRPKKSRRARTRHNK